MNETVIVSGVSGTAQIGDATTNELVVVSGVSGTAQTADVGAVIWTKVITSGNGTLY